MRYVIIGNGVAGTTAAANIRKMDREGTIIIITDEAYPFYSRIRLMDFLAGDVDEKGLVIRKTQWYEENKIDLFLETPVINVDHAKKSVLTSRGDAIAYDRLLLATGGLSFVPPIPGADKKGVFTLRTLKDAIAIRDYAATSGQNVILIGGGVLGLEAGNGLRKTGKKIKVVEFFPRLLPRQMDSAAASILRSQMENIGFQFFLGARSKEIIGKDKAEGLVLEDSSFIVGDMIIISAGVRPNVELAKNLGLPIEKGLPVNEQMETGIKDIYAAGDLVQHNGICYGIWPAADKQGEVAGINMSGGNAVYTGTTISNILKVTGIDLVAAGDIDADNKKDSIVIKDPANYIYKKLIIENNIITGAILYGDIKDRQKILKAMENKSDISSFIRDLEKWDLGRL